MQFSPRFLDDIRARLTLSEIIGQRVPVKRAGREHKACCPFHKEKTPSFTINDHKQFYHCFGCGAHGDVIGFVMQHDNLSFPETVEILAGQAGLSMPKMDPVEIKRAEKAKSLYNLMNDTTLFFQDQLTGDSLKYLTNRGLTEETLQSFRLGYAPADGQVLRKHLKALNYTDAQMIEAGVLKKSTRGGEPYGFFRERIMFPVSDRRGRVVAFGGRIMPDHLRAPDRGDFVPPKYINSSDTPLFNKSKILYGESLARQAARDGADIIVTEGYMDVILAHQSGFTGSVAPMGTALTEDQILSLWTMCPDDQKVPVLCFDGDNAGRRAAGRGVERVLPLLGPGRSVKIAFLPDGEDPDTLIRTKGENAFKAVVQSALSLFDFMWLSHTTGKNFDTPEERSSLSQTMHNQISLIAHRDVQAHYRKFLNDKISEVFFSPSRQKSGGRGAGGPYKSKRAHQPNIPPVRLRRPRVSKDVMKSLIIMATALNHPHVYDALEEYLGRIVIPNPAIDKMRQHLIATMTEHPNLDRAEVHTHLKDAGFGEEMRDILSQSVYVHASFCAPSCDSDQVKTGFVRWINDFENRDWKDINTGWKQAFAETDKDKENQIKAMMGLKSVEKSA